jgi:hypothetical protein
MLRTLARAATRHSASHTRAASTVVLGRDTNQALGLGQYACDFINGNYAGDCDDSVYVVDCVLPAGALGEVVGEYDSCCPPGTSG